MIDPTALDAFRRGVQAAARRSRDEALDAALTELGWLDALEVDPQIAVSILFEAQGTANTNSGALGWVLATSLGFDDPRAGKRLVLPPLDHDRPPGRLLGDRFEVRGLLTSGPASDKPVLVVTETDERWVSVVVDPGDLPCRPIQGLDPELELFELTGAIARTRTGECRPVDWENGLALGRRALGHELIGSSRAMLELARLHALDRVQFDRPVASFQAVRHRLADCLVAIEGAEALLEASWENPAPVHSAMAKASAGRAAQLVGRHCQQVLAGIGFTTEHPFHRHLRRSLALDQLLGAGSALTRRLGAEVLQRGQLPPHLEL